MHDYRFTADTGVVSFVIARNRSTVIRIFCEAEGCDIEYVENHCKITRLKPEKRYDRLGEKK